MTAFLAVLCNDIRLVFLGWRTVLLMLTLPVAMLLIMTAALAPLRDQSVFVKPFSVVLVDNEQSVWTEMLVRQLKQVTLIDEVLRVDEPTAIRLIREGKAAAAIVLPEGLSESVGAWQPVVAKVYGSSQQSLQSNIIRHVGQVGANIVSSGLSALEVIRETEIRLGLPEAAVAEDVGRAFNAFFLRVLARRDVFTENGTRAWAVTLVEYYTAGLMAVFLLFASLSCMKRMVEDRRNGILRRFLSAPVAPWIPVVSRLIVSLMVSGLQFSLLVLVTLFAFKSYWGVPAYLTFALFLTTVMASSGFALLVAAVADSPATVDLAGYLGVLVMAVTGGSLYPATAMPEWVRPISALTVVRWTREGFLGIFSGQTAEIGRSCIMLAGLALLFLSLAVLTSRFRKGRV